MHGPTPHAYTLPHRNHQKQLFKKTLVINRAAFSMSGNEQAPLDILEDGELPEESMEVTQTVAVVPPTPTAGTGRLCDGWGREQENCADRTSQTSQTRYDSARTRQVQIGNKSMFFKVNRPSSSVEGHPLYKLVHSESICKLACRD